jgi:solute carrier family 7 (L-type amino acid transporter), member 9/15
LATVIFAMNAILLGFTAAGCIVSLCHPHSLSDNSLSL